MIEIVCYPVGAPIPPVHPGETLRAELAARGMSSRELSLKVRVPVSRLRAIMRGKTLISAETALRLGRYFGTGAVFWMRLQARYDLAVAERDLGRRIAHEVMPDV